MNRETKICQNCKNPFEIDAQDFQFYDKIKVPPPTWCPECRLQRRMLVRNEHFLYRSKSGKSGREILSMFPPDAKVNAYDYAEWLEQDWDMEDFGREYDFNRPFFAQFMDLLRIAPLPNRSLTQPINSDYCNNASYIKNCYLSYGLMRSEGMLYCEHGTNCKDCVDSTLLDNSDFSYESFSGQKCSATHYSSYCEDCYNVYFCKDCIGCSNCFGCVGLKNKSHCIFNKQYNKNEYLEKIKEFNLGSRAAVMKLSHQAKEFWLRHPVRRARNYRDENCTGEHISNSKNVKDSYQVAGGENLRFCSFLLASPARDSYDYYRFGANAELIYECTSCGDQISNIKFSYGCFNNCRNIEYSFLCDRSSNLFGCVGLLSKQYCILNKQYSKEEYESIVPKIIQHMKDVPYIDRAQRTYGYGEFFPPEMSPFSYNESIVQEYFPLTRLEAEKYGSFWREPDDKNYIPTMKPEDIPDEIGSVSDDILKEVLSCSHLGRCSHQCTKAFKLIPDELQFYKKFGIPIPDSCPNCRYFERMSQRASIKMWQRKCQCGGSKSSNEIYQNMSPHQHGDEPCPNEFETSYAPDRPEIVYCENCYNQEVV